MSDIISSALISGICVAIPSLIATYKSNNKANALTEHKINELTKKVEKHNNVIERTSLLEERIKVTNHRIDDIESQCKRYEIG